MKNKDDFIILDRIIHTDAGMINIKWTHVEAHAGIVGNEEADKLAVAGSKI